MFAMISQKYNLQGTSRTPLSPCFTTRDLWRCAIWLTYPSKGTLAPFDTESNKIKVFKKRIKVSPQLWRYAREIYRPGLTALGGYFEMLESGEEDKIESVLIWFPSKFWKVATKVSLLESVFFRFNFLSPKCCPILWYLYQSRFLSSFLR